MQTDFNFGKPIDNYILGLALLSSNEARVKSLTLHSVVPISITSKLFILSISHME